MENIRTCPLSGGCRERRAILPRQLLFRKYNILHRGGFPVARSTRSDWQSFRVSCRIRAQNVASRTRAVFPNFANMRERKKPYSVPDELRTRIMRSNKSHGNLSTELTLARLMRASRISGWRRRVLMTGRPDFVFKQQRVALFIDGCYWHGCKCRRLPKRNRRYWEEKFRANQERDKRITRELRAMGWNVVRFWE